MQKEFTLETLPTVAVELLEKLKAYTTWAFDASMGAGKTTFIHALCNVLQVTDTVSSPTFPIINQYKTTTSQTIYHMDLYRVKDEYEAINAGIEDCLYSGNICLVEWPEKAAGIFPDDTLHVTITSVDDNTRKLKFNL